MIKLTVYENDIILTALEISNDEELVAGRSKKTDLVLSHEKVSREHIKIYFSADQWIVEDLDSKNGTTIDGERIVKHALADGDVINIAMFSIQVHLEELKPPPDEDETVIAEEVEFGEEVITSDDRTIPDTRKVPVPPPVDEPAMDEIPAPAEMPEEEAPDESVHEKTEAMELVAEEPEEEGGKDRIEIIEEPAGIAAKNSIEVIEGMMQGNVCGFDNHILVGRSTNCDMLILDETVSREHFTISFVKNKYVLTNLNQNNVTNLNGKIIKKANVRDGDIIKIGETILKVRIFAEKKNIAWKGIIKAVAVIVLLAALLMVFLNRQEIIRMIVKEQPEQAGVKNDIIKIERKRQEAEKNRRISKEAEKKRQELEQKVKRLLSESKELYKNKEYKKARAGLIEAGKLSSSNKEVFGLLSTVNTAIKKEEERQRREKFMAKVKELHANGMKYYDNGDYYLALKEFQNVVSLNIESNETMEARKLIPAIQNMLFQKTSQYYDSGIEYYEQEDYAGVLTMWQKVLDIYPEHAEAKKGISELLMILEQKAKVLYQEGLVFEKLGKINKAVEKWNKIIETVTVRTNEYYQKAVGKLQEHGEE